MPRLLQLRGRNARLGSATAAVGGVVQACVLVPHVHTCIHAAHTQTHRLLARRLLRRSNEGPGERRPEDEEEQEDDDDPTAAAAAAAVESMVAGPAGGGGHAGGREWGALWSWCGCGCV